MTQFEHATTKNSDSALWRWRVCDTKRCILLEMDTSNTKGEIGSAYVLIILRGGQSVQ